MKVNIKISDSKFPEEYLSKLESIGEKSGNYNIVVTSTSRTPYDQARVMYDNIIKFGVDKQKALYKTPGKKVISEYEILYKLGLTKEEIISGMEKKIINLGPSNVSKHCSSYNNVADVSIRSLTNPDSFLIESKVQCKKVIDERSSNGCFHLEF